MVIVMFKRIELCLENRSGLAYRLPMMHKHCVTLGSVHGGSFVKGKLDIKLVDVDGK